MPTVGLRILEIPFRVTSVDPEWVRLVSLMWAPLTAHVERAAFEIDISPTEEGWKLELPDGRHLGSDDAWMLLLALRTTMDEHVIARRREIPILHAVGVSRGDTSLLIVGESGSGKTSLGLELLRRGWRFVCDDVAPVDGVQFHVLPVPRPIGVRGTNGPAVDLLRGQNLPNWLPRPEGPFLLPAHVFALERLPVFVSHMFFSSFHSDTPSSVTGLSPGQAAALCARYVRPLDPRAVAAVAALARVASSREIRFGDAGEAADRVEEIVSLSRAVSYD